jgi:hypothetical protein
MSMTVSANAIHKVQGIIFYLQQDFITFTVIPLLARKKNHIQKDSLKIHLK